MNRVYVVAWEYSSGGGFDWFFDAPAADRAFVEEKKNVEDPALARDNWTAARYDVEVAADPRAEPDKVTREIDAQCCELFDTAPMHYPARVTA